MIASNDLRTKRSGDLSLADSAEPYNCVTHGIFPIYVDVSCCRFRRLPGSYLVVDPPR